MTSNRWIKVMMDKKNILICLLFLSFKSLHSLDLNDNYREPHPETRLFDYYDLSDVANEVYVSISDDNLVTICSKGRRSLDVAFCTFYCDGKITAIDSPINAGIEFERLKRRKKSNCQKEEVKKLIEPELSHHVKQNNLECPEKYFAPELEEKKPHFWKGVD